MHESELRAPNRASPFLESVRADLPWGMWAFPGVLAIFMSIPCIGLSYLWDDYAFLNNALHSSLWDFLPSHGEVFYRPISRGLYFYLLYVARDFGPLLGHIINVLTLGVIACLIGSLGTRLGGRRVGTCAGILFAGLACIPTLVAWTCCSQDLLAMLFVLIAIHHRLSGRVWVAYAFMALGVLSKETTIVAIPALLFLDRALGRAPGRQAFLREVGAYLAMILAWAAIHPGIRVLIGRGFRAGGTGYVGLARIVDILRQAAIYVLEVCNLRVGALDLTWSSWQIAVLLLSVAGAVFGLWRMIGSKQRGSKAEQVPGLVRLAALLAVGPWILTSAMILGTSQYYAAFPGMGSSLILGSILARQSRAVIAAVVAIFLVLGLWSRSTDMKNAFLTESDLRISSAAHVKLWKALLHIQPSFPPNSQVLISVQAHGRLRVYHQVYAYQMPALWYRDPTLRIRKPENRKPGSDPEFLFSVTNDLDVIRIDPFIYRTETSSGRPAEYLSVEQALRTYSMGLAASGETDAAARLLVEMPEVDASFESFHHRMAVMYLLAEGRVEDAHRLEAGIPPATRSWALDNLHAILAQQPSVRNFDAEGLQAFGIDSTDVGAIRDLTRWYLGMRYSYPGGRFAERLLRLAPGDSTALAAIAVRDSVTAALAKQRVRDD